MSGEFHAFWGPNLFTPPSSASGRPSLAAETEDEKTAAARRPSPVRLRETASMRMKRVVSQRQAAQLIQRSASAPAPAASLQDMENTAESDDGGSIRSKVLTLEQLCIIHVALNATQIQDNALDLVPDYLRQRIFEEVRARNQMLLSGRTLLTLCKGAHFTSLNLKNAANVRDADLQAIAPSLLHIRSLDLSHCSYVTDTGLGVLLRYCSSLTELCCERIHHLDGHNSLRLNSASAGLTNLKILSLAGCESMLDISVRSTWRRADSLVDLNLSSCEKLTDEAVDGLVSDNLKRLSLAYCSKMSDAGVSSVIRGCTRLEKLNLIGCGITDTSLRAAAARLGELRSLDVSFVERVTDAGIERIAKQCTLLESLSLEQNQNITDASMIALAENSRSLQHLNVGFCHLLNESGILRVFTDCALRSLQVTQCRRISSQTKFWLVTRLAAAELKRSLKCAAEMAQVGDSTHSRTSAGSTAE